MSKLLYNLFLFVYAAGIRMAALWSPKARLWLQGRRLQKIAIGAPAAKTIWMHCASLGEFEQGRPVLESLKDNNPSVKTVLTFFSPSGYEACKNYKGADHIFYLPMDNMFSAKSFIDAVNPSMVLWVKYEYWFYYLHELKKRDIPVLLISGVFRPGQPFFKWYGSIWKQMLESFTHLFLQNEASKKLLGSLAITDNVTVSGDTRFDRVTEIVKKPLEDHIVSAFCNNAKVIVAGSTWEDDEVILSAYADETQHLFKLIIVPHELDKNHLNTVKKLFKKSVCYTDIQTSPGLLGSVSDYKVLIVDTMGMLSRLYSAGFINYVGGGFTNDGIHNILEAAVWGKPVIIGENYEKYAEAVDLVECGAAESIADTNELKEVIDYWLKQEKQYKESAAAARQYVFDNAGATEKIINYIQENRLLTS